MAPIDERKAAVEAEPLSVERLDRLTQVPVCPI
jgi:hypothetical protein